MDCRRGTNGLQKGYEWTAEGVRMDCRWGTNVAGDESTIIRYYEATAQEDESTIFI